MDDINAKVLAAPMGHNDVDAATVHDYLKALLAHLIEQGEGFSGKRPFGNSGWFCDLEGSLVKAGLVKGRLDSEGFVDFLEEGEEGKPEKLIIDAIKSL